MKNKILILTIMMVIALFSINIIFADTTITDCGTYNLPGKYNLSSNLNSTGTCLTFVGSNIELDCKGYSIKFGTTAGTVYGINAYNATVSQSNLTIKNCNITTNNTLSSSRVGIQIYNYSSSYIYNNTILTNGTSVNYGILMTNTEYTVIDLNNIKAQGTTTNNNGIYISSGVNYCNITNNIISSQGTVGSTTIYIASALSPRINNIFSGNKLLANLGTTSSYGINILNNVSSNTLKDNNITVLATGGGTAIGILVTAIAGSPTDYNIFTNNTMDVRSTGAGSNQGIFITGGNYNNITNNIIFVNGTTSIIGTQILGTATLPTNNNIIDSNIFTLFGVGATSSYGVYIKDKANINKVTYNNISMNGASTLYGIYAIGSASNVINNTDVLFNNVTITGTAASNHPVYFTANIENTNISNNKLISSGGTTPNYGVYVLGGTGLPCNNNWISFNQINITASGASCTGILLSTNVNTNYVNDNVIRIRGGTTLSDGIQVIGTTLLTSKNNFINRNTIASDSNAGRGIMVTSNVDNGEIKDNVIRMGNATSTTLNYGIYVFGNTMTANNYTITGNNIYTIGTGITNNGIYISSNTSYNLIQNNIINMSSGGAGTAAGIYTTGAVGSLTDYNVIDRNNITVNCYLLCYGIYSALNMHYCNITNNIIRKGAYYGITTGATGQGIGLLGGSTSPLSNFLIQGNDIFNQQNTTSTASHGMSVSSSVSNITIRDNIISINASSSSYGFYSLSAFATPAEDIYVINNTITTYVNAGTNPCISIGTTIRRWNITDNILNCGIGGTVQNRGITLTGLALNDTGNINVLRNNIKTTGIGTSNDGIYVFTSLVNVTVKDNIMNLSGPSIVGVTVSGGTNANIEYLNVINNTITIQNLSANGSNVGFSATTSVNNVLVENNTFYITGTTANQGISFFGLVNNPSDNNTVNNNRITIMSGVASATQYGIHASGKVNNYKITNNILNLTGGTSQYPIYLLNAVTTPATGAIVDNNSIIMFSNLSNNFGVFVSSNWAYVNITNNILNLTCIGTACQGIRVAGLTGSLDTHDIRIVGNDISHYNGSTTSYGIVIFNSIFNSYVAYNKVYIQGVTTPEGCFIGGSADAPAEYNIIEYNNFTTSATVSAYGCEMQSNANNNIFRYNNFDVSGATLNYGLELLSTSVLDLTGNQIYNNNIKVNSTGAGISTAGLYMLTNVVTNYIYNNNITVYANKTSNGAYFLGTTYPVTDNKFYNNSIDIECNYADSNDCYGIYLLNGANGNNISRNTILTNGSGANYGIFTSISVDNIFEDNNISSDSRLNTSDCIRVSGNAKYNTFKNNKGYCSGHEINLIYSGFAPDFTTLENNNLVCRATPNTFNLYVQNTAAKSIDSLTLRNQYVESYNFTGRGTTNLLIENTTTGSILFNTLIKGNGTNMNTEVQIKNNNISVDTTSSLVFNKSATLTMYNIPSFSSPVANRDSVLCTAFYCGALTYLGNNIYTFVVNSWSSYSIAQDTNLFKYLCDWISSAHVKPFYTYDDTFCDDFNFTVYTKLNDPIYMANIYTENVTTCDIELINTSVLATNGTLCWQIYVDKEAHHQYITDSINFTTSTLSQDNSTVLAQMYIRVVNN